MPRGFWGWIREESFAAFLLKVTAISGLELALTTLWLQVVLLGPTELGQLLPAI